MAQQKWLPGMCAILLASLCLAGCNALTIAPTPAPPTPTPPPTVNVAAVQTAAVATVVARLAMDATATAAAIPTSTRTPVPTTTPQPTATATHTPRPTLRPTKTPTPDISLELSGMRYEIWGNPQRGCASFDDTTRVRKFNLEMTLTNHSDQAIRDWYPDFYSNSGRLLLTCFYAYSAEGFPTVPPGEQRTITFASFCNLDEYVKEMKVNVLEIEYHRCFSPEGALIACP